MPPPISRSRLTRMPSLHQDFPMPAWTAALAMVVIFASAATLYALSLAG